MTSADAEVIDCWVNVPVGEPDATAAYLFPGMVERWAAAADPAGLVDQMDAAGVDRAVLASGWGEADSIGWVRDAMQRFPGRFIASHIVDPRGGMKTLALMSDLVRNDGYAMMRMTAFATQVGYGDPRCYPVYAKCAELGVPIGLNVGIPGPQVPGRCQDPMPLDEVCWHFPELKLILSHGGEPWDDLCVKMMLKWPNLHYMTSAFAPRYIPAPILHYMNSRGADRILFASDHPIIPFDRCLREVAAMTFRDDSVRRKFLGGNARRLLVGEG